MNVLLCLSHSIEEYDQVRLLSGAGYGVASIGGYIDPAHPHDPKRPPLPEVPCIAQIKRAVDAQETDDNLGAAQRFIPDAALEWLGDDGVIIYHHYLERLFGQWDRIRDWKRGSRRRRVVWRTVGQSVEHNERLAHHYRAEGLEIVRYSPAERNIPAYAGEDALIRFWKDPTEWSGWTGEQAVVINVTQHLRQRDPYTNWGFWEAATQGLPRVALGPGSEAIGGPGELSLDEMVGWLRRARAYLYTGTQPASYTLGLVEAMMTGIPVVSIAPQFMRVFPYGPALFEGHLLAGNCGTASDGFARSDEQVIANTRGLLSDLLAKRSDPSSASAWRQRTVELFGRATIAAQWRAFLG